MARQWEGLDGKSMKESVEKMHHRDTENIEGNVGKVMDENRNRRGVKETSRIGAKRSIGNMNHGNTESVIAKPLKKWPQRKLGIVFMATIPPRKSCGACVQDGKTEFTSP